jgi:hypothetical protein
VTGLIRGFGRGKGHFIGGKEVSTHARFYPSRTHDSSAALIHDAPELFRASLKVVVGEERHSTAQRTLHMAQRFKSACTHIRVRTARLPLSDRGRELLTPLPPHVPIESIDPGVGMGR